MSRLAGRGARRGASLRLAVLAAGSVALLPACRLDVARVRTGQPIDHETFDELEVGRTTREEALAKLDAPDRVGWETGKSRLTWEHLDTTRVQLRLQVPFSLFGYRHNFFRYFQDRDNFNTMDLLFDGEGILEQKSLRLPDAYRDEDERATWWRLHLSPRFEHSFLLVGDADFDDYDELFENGILLGADIGIQPVAPLTLSLGGRYHLYEGRSLSRGGSRVSFDDLELFGAEANLRIQLPLRVLNSADNLQNAWRLLIQGDPRRHDGWIVFVEGGLGVNFNENVPLRIDGLPAGNFFDEGLGLATSASTGLEYSWENLSLRAGITFRTTDGFDEGNSPLESDDADSLQSLGGMASLSVKF